MNPFLWLVDTLIQLYIWILIAAAVLSWLIAFNVVNTRNPIVAIIGDFLYRITEPALRPIRNVMPNLGGIDISPVILILGLLFLENIFWLYRSGCSCRCAVGQWPWIVAGRRPDARRAADAQGRARRHRRHRAARRRPRRAEGAGARGAERGRGQCGADPADRQGARRADCAMSILSPAPARASSGSPLRATARR